VVAVSTNLDPPERTPSWEGQDIFSVCDVLPFPKPSVELSPAQIEDEEKEQAEKRSWSPVGFGKLPFSAALFRDVLWPFFVALSRCFLCDFLFHS